MSELSMRNAPWSYVLDEQARILVADDDPILREFASVHLSTPTATVVTVPDGDVAFNLLKSEHFDIAVLDIEMPVLNGFGLLERIRSDGKLGTLPVMMLTGHEDITSIDRAFNLGANAFSSKPVNWRLLSYQIRYVLRSSLLERQALLSPPTCPELPALSEDRSRWQTVLDETEPYGRRKILSPTAAEACLQRIADIATHAIISTPETRSSAAAVLEST